MGVKWGPFIPSYYHKYPISLAYRLKKHYSFMTMLVHTSAKHATNVSMSLIETLVHDGINKRRSMEEKSFIIMLVILLRYLLPPMTVTLPQSLVTNLLNLRRRNKR